MGNSIPMLQSVKTYLGKCFAMKDLVYGGDLKQELRVSCYTDAGYLTDADDLKSQTGYVFVLNGGAVDWKNAKQSIFATSSVEAKYITAFDASKEAVWVKKFISRLGVVPTIEEPISMYCDNTGAIAIANESGITKEHTKNIGMEQHLKSSLRVPAIVTTLEKMHLTPKFRGSEIIQLQTFRTATVEDMASVHSRSYVSKLEKAIEWALKEGVVSIDSYGDTYATATVREVCIRILNRVCKKFAYSRMLAEFNIDILPKKCLV
uniref:Retrovirus-related Pol polyprotein from transposon TNT 1-94 n=1 Tax=Tanacetum cinerariifolium TaxID=118510 RepID=A0A699IR01_TANCI|nr:retrovirus-related Pol polyprotein from transposon TNT 1-94 [Tanacetum cinerariifolium]